MFIEKINKVLTPDNINNFFDTTKTLNTKLKSTDVKEINKLVKDTDDTVVKIERVGDILNNFKTP